VTGVYYLSPVLTVPGGTIPCQSVALFVSPNPQVAPRLEDNTWLALTSRIEGQVPPQLGYTAASSVDWNNSPPTTVKAALDRIAAKLSPNP
jgi:hypothetical protein